MRRFTIKEPNEKEFNLFKREFLQKKQAEYYDSNTKKEIEKLMVIVGKFQSEIDELKHKYEFERSRVKMINTPEYTSILKLTKKQLPYGTVKVMLTIALNDLLFFELKTNQLYI